MPPTKRVCSELRQKALTAILTRRSIPTAKTGHEDFELDFRSTTAAAAAAVTSAASCVYVCVEHLSSLSVAVVCLVLSLFCRCFVTEHTGGEEDVEAISHPQLARSRDRRAIAWLAHAGVGHEPCGHAECE